VEERASCTLKKKENQGRSAREGPIFEASNSNIHGSKRTHNETTRATDPLEAARKLWKDSYYIDFYWIEFYVDLERIFCKTCHNNGWRYVYIKAGSINIKVSAFQDYMKSEEHKKLRWAKLNGTRRMEQQIKKASIICDEALLSLMRATCYINTTLILFVRFHELCKLLVSIKACITKSLYHDEKSCFDLILCISSVI
jgi:hypothetical protein